jgi:fructosamine-3-kinase
MLGDLAATGAVPVPRVLGHAPGLLLLEWLDHDAGAIPPSAERELGERLAMLHAVGADAFGYAYPTPIGPLPQANPRTKSWRAFFRDQRLRAHAHAALAEGALPAPLLDRLETLAARLPALLDEPSAPALLHGDLWHGNILHRAGRLVGLLDPSLQFGHPEAELAFTQLFGSLGPDFLASYGALRPLASGFLRDRAPLYNLVPLLVHLRLFGPGYLRPITATLDRFVGRGARP